MGWQPGADGKPGDKPGSALPAGSSSGAPGSVSAGGDPAGFARDGAWDACPPSAALAAALEAACGQQWRCPQASRDEMLGMARQWQALEAWAAAGKLGVLRALIRDEDQPLPGGGYRGDLPEGWTRSLTHEVSLALSMPPVSAELLLATAWNLQAALPGTGALLAAGQLTLAKARAVEQALSQLSYEDAAAAEAMIVPELPGKTHGQLQKLAVHAALTVDPESAARRREHAETNLSRVLMFREESGSAALSGRDLPTDQTLTAHASVCTRAQEYKDSRAFPAGTRMDQYRAAAYLDLLNGITATARIAAGQVTPTDRTGEPGGREPADDGPADDGRPEDEQGDDGPGGSGGPDSPGPVADGPAGGAVTSPPRLADLVIPLATLLGLAERPGEGHALGPLDPGLCRDLATAAAASPHTTFCLTVTSPGGITAGHGCARPARQARPGTKAGAAEVRAASGLPLASSAQAALLARINLTITADRLAQLTHPGETATPGQPARPQSGAWSLTRTDATGPPGEYGTWTLTLPDRRVLTVRPGPVPVLDCDHRHESRAYQPSPTLRHLVQIRDYQCTFPTCSRHARDSDFEHATPYDKGGKTCACNAGARSRRCHQVKQAKGWDVAQPQPGRHQWTTPTGRVYTQEAHRYPV